MAQTTLYEAGSKIDAFTTASGNVRQAIAIGDPSADAAVVAVKGANTAPAATDSALVVTISPNSGSVLASAIACGQAVIAVTSTAVRLPSAAVPNGVVVKAKPSNAAAILVGAAGVTTTYDGTGNGYPLAPGEAISFAVANVNLIYINGTAGDIVSYAGT